MQVTRLPPQFVTTCLVDVNSGKESDHCKHEVRVLHVVTPTLSSVRYARLTEQAACWLVSCEDDEVAGIDWTELDRMA